MLEGFNQILLSLSLRSSVLDCSLARLRVVPDLDGIGTGLEGFNQILLSLSF